MQYEMEELAPIAADLAKQFLGWESTSMTYEKAEQLMEAVVYCIREAEEGEPADSEQIAGQRTARQAYEAGCSLLESKVKRAMQLYHTMLPEFDSYGNRCLEDTFFKGIPEFFRWYDLKYAPQNTILMLDYPVLRDLTALTGVDRIYDFLRCLSLEQEFLKKLPAGSVQAILDEYAGEYRERIENLCEIVLIVLFRSFQGTEMQLRAAVQRLLEQVCGEKGALLMDYFAGAVDGIVARRAAETGEVKQKNP